MAVTVDFATAQFRNSKFQEETFTQNAGSDLQNHSIESEKWLQSSQPQSWAKSSKLGIPSFEVRFEPATVCVSDREYLHLGKLLQP